MIKNKYIAFGLLLMGVSGPILASETGFNQSIAGGESREEWLPSRRNSLHAICVPLVTAYPVPAHFVEVFQAYKDLYPVASVRVMKMAPLAPARVMKMAPPFVPDSDCSCCVS